MLNTTPGVTEVWTTYGDGLRAYLGARLPADQVDDVLQEVLVKTYERLPELRDLGALRAWLYRVARNAALDHLRRQARSAETVGAPFPEPAFEADPLEALPDGSMALSRCVRAFLAALPEADAALLEEIDLDGARQSEVAARLGVPPSTVKSRVQRARRRLARAFEQCCDISCAADGEVRGTPRAGRACGVTPRERAP